MLHIRFTGLIFGLLFVLHALKSCSVHAYQGGETVRERLLASDQETFVSVQKELLVGFGGRKMGGHEVVEIGGKQGFEVGGSKNSGENNDAEIIGKFQDQANNQVIGMNKMESKTRDFAGLGIPRSDHPSHLRNSMQLEESKAMSIKASLESHPSRSDKPVTQEPNHVIGNRVESKMLLEAAKEIVNLIHKDYKGRDRPRRKPPINNHVPRH